MNEEEKTKTASDISTISSDSTRTQITVTGLNFKTNVNDIFKAFSSFGKITEMNLVKNDSNESKGLCFIRFNTKMEAQRAIDATNGKRFDGNFIYTTWTLTKDEYATAKLERMTERASMKGSGNKFFLKSQKVTRTPCPPHGRGY